MFTAVRIQTCLYLTFCMLMLMGFYPVSIFAQEPTPETVAVATPAYSIESIPNDDVIGDFVVGPGKTEMQLSPGDSGRVELIVTNRTGEERLFEFEVEDVRGSANPEKSVELLGDDYGPYSLRDYIVLPTEPVVLGHAKRARIPVDVIIPADAEPGAWYGSVLVSTVTKKVDGNDTQNAVPKSAIKSRIGTLFFINTPGEVTHEGRLEKFATIPDKLWFQSGPIHFELLYKNTGSVHVNPYGEIQITNFFGDEVGFVEIQPWYALPDSLRFREVIWTREFLFGRYTATASINRGYEDIVDVMDVTFWVLPWKILLMFLAGVFIIVFLIRTFFKMFEFKRRSE